MASQVIAMPIGGLQREETTLSPGIHSLRATSLDHMQENQGIDNVSSNHANGVPTEKEAEEPEQPSSDSLEHAERKRAAGNLLAALGGPSHATSQLEPEDIYTPATKEEALDTTGMVLNDQAENAEMLGLQPANRLPANGFVLSEQSLLDFHNNLGDLPLPDLPESFDMPMDAQPLLNEYSLLPMEGISLPPALPPKIQSRKEPVRAFAKLEFEDGVFFMSTYSVELGRDLLAYHVALAKEEEAKAKGYPPRGSSGHASDKMHKSQVPGSVVSEAGGFGAIDEGFPAKQAKNNKSNNSHSSQLSASDVVRPQDVLKSTSIVPFDYHRTAEEQARLNPLNEQPAPVTDDHIPKPQNDCPLIPIHAAADTAQGELAANKGISRRHVKIYWDFDSQVYALDVMGRNGAYLDGVFLDKNDNKALKDGSRIVISGVSFTFRLPNMQADPSDQSDEEEREQPEAVQVSMSPMSTPDADESRSVTGEGSSTKPSQGTKPAAADTSPPLGPDGLPIVKRRGPGRPPKDGIMSTRERKEREKAAKLQQARAENGGVTPPPLARPKVPKAIEKEEPTVEAKPEKRKYKKRKEPEPDGDVLPSIEGGEDVSLEPEQPRPVKKARPSKSLSPEYPPVEAWTEEQLQRPTDPYATLIYDILMEIYPRALPLKHIYRIIKQRHPYFVHRADTDGWQSSVRHNLNAEHQKLFDKGAKEGKGFAWLARPEGRQQQLEKKRAAQQQSAQKPRVPASPRPQQPQQGSAPSLNWQPGNQFVSPNGVPLQGPPYVQGPNQMLPPPPNGMPHPPGHGPLLGNVPGQPPLANANLHPGHASHLPGPVHNPGNLSDRPPAHPTPPYQPSARPSPAQSTPQPPPAAPPPPQFSIAASNMPCTLDGVMAIQRFETAMYEQINKTANNNLPYWQQVFKSAKGRLLHGKTESSLPNGETKEETTICYHIGQFIEKHKNKNFKGFRNRLTEIQNGQEAASPSPSVTPAVVGSSSAVIGDTATSPAPAPPKAESAPTSVLEPWRPAPSPYGDEKMGRESMVDDSTENVTEAQQQDKGKGRAVE